MDPQRNFQEISYERHAKEFCAYASGSEKEKHAKTWLEKDTVDAWRHQRMYQVLDPVLMTEPKAKWLTIGDGRYGKDARYIIEKGGDALASDISDVLLKEAAATGYISKYRKENAESLSFSESEFDYVFCKESYHHFPRPMLAVYEMLRVAGKGVFLIEPNDPHIHDRFSGNFTRHAKSLIKILLGRGVNSLDCGFEESGNYIFSISKREIEKAALGLNYKMVAFKGINDAYFPGVEYEKLAANGPLQKNIKKAIKRADLLCKLGLRSFGILAAAILKKEPSEELRRRLVEAGFEVFQPQNNPYTPS